MRDLDGRMAEINRRSQARIKQIKKRRIGVLMTCVPVVLCVVLFMGLGNGNMGDKVYAPESALNQADGHYAVLETSGSTSMKDACETPESEDAATNSNADPVLEMIIAGKRIKADAGSWYETNTDAEGNKLTVDGGTDGLLELADITDPCVTTEADVQLVFSEQPDSVTIQCWPVIGMERDDENRKSIKTDGSMFRLEKGCYLYRVTADWRKDDGSYKGIRYYIYVELTD